MRALLECLSEGARSLAPFLVGLNLAALMVLVSIRPVFALMELRRQKWREKNWHKLAVF